MYDAATVLLREYYRVTGWNEQQSYTQLMRAASVLVDFEVPNGVLLSSASTQVPSLLSSARLLLVPLSGALGYTHVATPAPFDTRCIQHAEKRLSFASPFLTPDHPPGLLPYRDASAHGLWDALRRRAPPRDVLMYGCFHVPTTYVEGVVAMRLAPHWQLLMTALSNAPSYPLLPLARRLGLVAPGVPSLPKLVAPGATNLQLTLQMQTERTMAEYSYSVDDALWGMHVLRTLSAPTMLQPGVLSAGGEVFVSFAEMSAGFSLGMRYAQPPIVDAQGRRVSYPAVSSVTLNPMMGHVRYAYTAQAEEDLTLCARYDLNVYSYLSDLTLGAEYCLGPPTDDDARPAELPTASLREQRGVWKPKRAPGAELSLREDTLGWPAVRPAEVPPAPAPRPPDAEAPGGASVDGVRPDAVTPAAVPGAEDEPRLAAAPAEVRAASELPATPTVPPAPPAAPGPPYGLLKMRASASGLFALLWEGRWNQCLVSAGVQTQVSMHPTLSATSTLGCEIVYTEE
ncbi:Mitochondrial distribution and morphology protein 10 [Malassezia brasiliensis]|uniref:Mitochondrial distribution and morphology protein 10 n=1 Tax=Malassezia brasiliensis TaxID=1821822 RepID=A0AAF0DZ76_9BASI|nr:Mitochondrial distribution and morphology protein 10 [Malassezia brasiliensis]